MNIDGIEITGNRLVAQWKEAFQLGLAYGVSQTLVDEGASNSDQEVLRRANRMLRMTLKDEAYLTRFVDLMVDVARRTKA